jgi:hypothetical protein
MKQNYMNTLKRIGDSLGIIVSSALLGCSSYAQPSVSVDIRVPPPPSVQVTLPSVEIRAESDFYEPLTPHGEWVVVGSHGRCWRPAHVERDWRPYSNGNWQRTDDGWYWVSDEPWAWATYHYGRWDFDESHGWYWVPQTQWAPAWVSWHEGGGYVGWAPLQPSVSISVSGFVGFNQSRISPRAFVFVKPGGFLDPIRPTTVVVNNTTIIRNTVNITNTRIVNNTVINGGPETTVIERASGRKVQAVAVRQLRHKEEAVVIAKHKAPNASSSKKDRTPEINEAEARGKKTSPAEARATIREPAAAAANDHKAQNDKRKTAPAIAVSRTEPRTESNRPQPRKESSPAIKVDKHVERPVKSAGPSDSKKKSKTAADDKPDADEKDKSDKPEKGHGKKTKD